MLITSLLTSSPQESLVHSLIEAYGLLERTMYARPHYLPRLLTDHRHHSPISPASATDADLEAFHSSEYVQALKRAKSLQGNDTALDEEHGLCEDCPLFAGSVRSASNANTARTHAQHAHTHTGARA